MTARHRPVRRGSWASRQVRRSVALAWLGLAAVGQPGGLTLGTAAARPGAVAAAAAAPPGAGVQAGASCLPQRRVDLGKLIAEQAVVPRNGAAKFVAVSRGSPRWMAGFNLGIAWENGDCPGFADFAQKMGYEAFEVIDTPTGEHHFVVLEKAGRHNGLFVFRAPAERAKARPLVITAPHVGFDFQDDRASRLYREVKAVAYLQNTAHRCSSQACSSCSEVINYACGGCPRVSDVAHSADNLLFAVYAGLEAVRKDLRFEYHGAGAHAELPGCHGSAHLSQGSTVKLTAQQDDGSYPSRFWQALEKRLGPQCVCYHQRESGCQLSGSASILGRLTNQESEDTFDPCGQPATRLSGRFLHFEWHEVAVADVIAALGEAVPLPP